MARGRKGPLWLLNIGSLAVMAGLVTFVVYLPALQNGFVSWDDNFYIYENDHIRHLNGEFFRWAFSEFYASNWHPLTWLSHAVDYAVWGLDPAGHHLSNNLLHSINTLLVTILAYRLLEVVFISGSGPFMDKSDLPAIALITGLLFGLHPLHVESVAWISERKDLLCAFFYLSSLLFYLRLRGGLKVSESFRNPNYLASLALFALALMSKPMAVSLPLVLLLLDGLRGDAFAQGRWRDNLLAKAPFFILALASAVVTIAAQKSGHAISSLEEVPLFDRLWVASYALIAYLQKMLWPLDLLPYYAYPKSVEWSSPRYLGAALLVLLITLASVLSARRQRGWVVAWGYYLITLMPVLGIVQVGSQLMADRYTYLPSITPFMLLALLLVWLLRLACRPFRSAVLYLASLSVITVVVMGLLSSLTQQQIRIWKDGETLWRYVIQYDDQIPLAYRQLGIALYEQAQYAAAAEMMSRALELKPLDAELLNNLAICYLELGFPDRAMQAIRRALKLDASNLFALNTLGKIYMARREYAHANRVFLRALQLEPENPLRVFNLAVSFDKLGDLPGSCRYWRRYMRVDVTGADDAEIIQHLKKLGCPPGDPE